MDPRDRHRGDFKSIEQDRKKVNTSETREEEWERNADEKLHNSFSTAASRFLLNRSQSPLHQR